MTLTRTEADSMGELEVPADALYGAQTQRAINNFPVSGQRLPEAFVRALLFVKSAAASANVSLGHLPADIGAAIEHAIVTLQGDEALMRHFPVDIYQTGSGTSTNMNANEVIATLAARHLGSAVGANDHVNCSQSSNDVVPTTLHVSAVLALEEQLLPSLSHLVAIVRRKAAAVHQHVKTGRTHLMDAMPVRMSQTLNAWADQIEDSASRIRRMLPELQALAQGGTAVGTGVNAPSGFADLFCERLGEATGYQFRPADNFFTRIGCQDTVVALSGQLKVTAVSLMKISNDLRWMNSGPLAGLGEIELQALQPGSSIMPGKVNPVIPESTAMVAAQVIGNDTAITVAGQSGNFELNVMLPLLVNNLLNSIALLSSSARLLADKAIASFTVREDRLQASLGKNPILVTALNPVIGYAKAAAIAKQAYAEGLPIIDVAARESGLGRAELERLLDPVALTEQD
ncbi:MAG: class II fumarate hydratase [Pseudomonadota bacterium]